MVKYILGGKEYRTKLQVTEAVRVIFAKYSVGKNLQGDDLNFALDLLKHHEDYEGKTKYGVKTIGIRFASGHKHFVIVSLKDDEIDFSYKVCLKAPTPLQNFANACRVAVMDDIQIYKQRLFDSDNDVYCNISGIKLTWDTVHIDHVRKFREIVQAFIEEYKIDVDKVKYGDMGVIHTLLDKIAEDFRKYHTKSAVLRPLHYKENLKLG